MSWEHDALAADLLDARHAAGEIAIERLAVHGGQLDVATMRLSWSRPELTGFEVKVSRADFLADMRAAKWRNYLPCVERLTLAVPAGLVDPLEVPGELGLVVRGAKGWRTVRRPPAQRIEEGARRLFVQSLLFRHYPAPWQPSARGLLTLPNGRRVTVAEIQAGEVRTLYGKTVPLDTPLEPWEREYRR